MSFYRFARLRARASCDGRSSSSTALQAVPSVGASRAARRIARDTLHQPTQDCRTTTERGHNLLRSVGLPPTRYLFTGVRFSSQLEPSVRSHDAWRMADGRSQSADRRPTMVPLRPEGHFERRQEPDRWEQPTRNNAKVLLEPCVRRLQDGTPCSRRHVSRRMRVALDPKGGSEPLQLMCALPTCCMLTADSRHVVTSRCEQDGFVDAGCASQHGRLFYFRLGCDHVDHLLHLYRHGALIWRHAMPTVYGCRRCRPH